MVSFSYQSEWLGDSRTSSTSEPPPTTEPASSTWPSQTLANSETRPQKTAKERKRLRRCPPRLRPHLAFVSMHNPLNGGQSYAGTFESLLRVKTLEYAKQLVQVLHIRSYSIVFDKYHRLIRVVGRRTYLGWILFIDVICTIAPERCFNMRGHLPIRAILYAKE